MSDYDYELPAERIAAYPAERRDASRLMVLRTGNEHEHTHFSDVVQLFEPGDVLVINDSRVLPARLMGKKPTGGAAEVLLLRPDGNPKEWRALVRPSKKLKVGVRIVVADDLEVEVIPDHPDGTRRVRLHCGDDVEEVLNRVGRVPLPPYLGRLDEALDRSRYQTVYADEAGSVAAPTAGLHFTHDLLGAIADRGVLVAPLTLHVGVGTFRPIDGDDPDDHMMHAEDFALSGATAESVNETRVKGGRVWAVGTTTVRTLESCASDDGRVHPRSGATQLFLRPPYRPKVVDGVITNFHLPRSTLLMLVAAFTGYERMRSAYETAIEHGYRFYSYGDAMVIPPEVIRSANHE